MPMSEKELYLAPVCEQIDFTLEGVIAASPSFTGFPGDEEKWT